MPNYTTCVSCECGARYERAEVTLPIKDVGIFDCHHCGAALEHWQGKVVPQFRLVAAPEQRKSSAA